MSDKFELSVVLPAYLEEENLRLLLPRLNNVLKNLTKNYEVIVVDTLTAIDHTKDVCMENDVIYVNRENGNSFGDAVRTGIAKAKGHYILFMDADGSHEPEFIRNIWENRTNYDVVVASRYIEGGLTENPYILILMSRVLNIVYAALFKINCKDVSNSFKLYSGEKLRGITLRCNNFDIVEEMLIKLGKKFPPLRIKEIPFVFRKRMFGMTKRNLWKFIATYCYSIVKLLFESSKS